MATISIIQVYFCFAGAGYTIKPDIGNAHEQHP